MTKMFEDYNKAYNLVKSSLRNAGIMHFSNQLNLHKTYLAKSWKILKNIIGKDSKSAVSSTLNIDNQCITDDTKIANGLNIFVCQLFTD